MTEELYKMRKKLKKYLDKDRFHHTIGVMYTASCLAMRYGISLEKAEIAGLLHDCAKCIPNDEKLKLCKRYRIQYNKVEEANPGLLHAKLGAYLANKKYDIKDKEILSAITYHTTGCPAMTVLEQIIYIADYIEPSRNVAPNLPVIRELAFKDLDLCMYQILKDSLDYLSKKSIPIDPATEETYIYYRDKINNTENK